MYNIDKEQQLEDLIKRVSELSTCGGLSERGRDELIEKVKIIIFFFAERENVDRKIV